MFLPARKKNGISNPNMKKLITWKRPSLIAYFVLIFVVLLYTFKSQIMPYYFRIQFRSPVVFHNVRITFPKGIIFNAGDKSVVLFHWEDPQAFLILGKINLNKITKEYLLRFFGEKCFDILETNDTHFKDNKSFTISYIDTSWKYNKAIYVISKNLRITYQGTKENYQEFKDIIDNMEFL